MTNLLIIHQGALGDFVLTFPAILRLKRIFSQIHALCQDKLGKMACALNIIDKHYPLEAGTFASLYSDSPDSGVRNILQSYNKIIIFSNSEQLGHMTNIITGNKAVRIPPRPDICQKIHVADYITENVARSDLPGQDYNLPVLHTDRRDRNHDPDKIFLHPGSGSTKKNWPVSNFMKTCDILKSKGMKPEFISGPAEDFLVKELSKQENHIHAVSDLNELVCLLKKAGGFIGNDSGVTHVAAFLGLPTIAVFGPSDPDRWKPVGQRVKVIRPDLDCSPCFETDKDKCGNMECFDKTMPEMVVRELDLQKIHKYLSKSFPV